MKRMKDEIKVIVKGYKEDVGHWETVKNDLKSLQALVDGHIETFHAGKGAVVLCNEEGLIRGYHFNCRVGIHWVFGNIAVVGVDDEYFTDCPITLEEWKEMLK